MSKHDLQARPTYQRARDSLEAHLTTVLTAVALSHWIDAQTSWNIERFVRDSSALTAATAPSKSTPADKSSGLIHSPKPLAAPPPARQRPSKASFAKSRNCQTWRWPLVAPEETQRHVAMAIEAGERGDIPQDPADKLQAPARYLVNR
jgi:hypothetical protein